MLVTTKPLTLSRRRGHKSIVDLFQANEKGIEPWFNRSVLGEAPVATAATVRSRDLWQNANRQRGFQGTRRPGYRLRQGYSSFSPIDEITKLTNPE